MTELSNHANHTNHTLDRIEEAGKELGARILDAQRAGVKLDVLQESLTQFGTLLMQVARSPVGVELGKVVQSRLQSALAQSSTETLLSLVIAEYLRSLLRTIEQASYLIIDIADKQYPQRQTDDRMPQAPEAPLARALVQQLEILCSELRTAETESQCIPAIIPSTLAMLATQAQLDQNLVIEALPARTNHCPSESAIEARSNPLAVNEPATVRQVRYWTHTGKEHDLRRAAHAFAYDLIDSVRQHRATLDSAQGNGYYAPASLRAVADAMCQLAKESLSDTEDLVARAKADVRFWVI